MKYLMIKIAAILLLLLSFLSCNERKVVTIPSSKYSFMYTSQKIVDLMNEKEFDKLKSYCTESGYNYIIEETDSLNDNEDIIIQFFNINYLDYDSNDTLYIFGLDDDISPKASLENGYFLFEKKNEDVKFKDFRPAKC